MGEIAPFPTFKHVNVMEMARLIPPWACNVHDVAQLLESAIEIHGDELIEGNLPKFWVEVVEVGSRFSFSICTPSDAANMNGYFIVECTSPYGRPTRFEFGVGEILLRFGLPRGPYSVYMHSLQLPEMVGKYVGITKHP